MAYVPREGLATSRTQPSIGRSLSLQDFHSWRTTSSPLDIPGALPPSAQRISLLTTSLPENADAALSRTLLEQCCLDDQSSNASPKSSRRERGSWTSTIFSDCSTTKTSLSTQRSANRSLRLVSDNHGRTSSSFTSPAGEEPTFTKHTSSANRNGSQTSALSAALRCLPYTSDPAEHLRRQNRITQRGYRESWSIHSQNDCLTLEG